MMVLEIMNWIKKIICQSVHLLTCKFSTLITQLFRIFTANLMNTDPIYVDVEMFWFLFTFGAIVMLVLILLPSKTSLVICYLYQRFFCFAP